MKVDDIVTYFYHPEKYPPEKPPWSCDARIKEIHDNQQLTLVLLPLSEGFTVEMHETWYTRDFVPRGGDPPTPFTWSPK